MKKILLGLMLLASTSAWAEDTRPNILFIVAEDMSPRIHAFGDAVAVTPTLDALSAQGTNFPNTYTTSGVCAPSRAGLITGISQTAINAQHMRTRQPNPALGKGGGPIDYEAVPPANVKAFPELLRAAGYYTYTDGKTDYQFGDPFTVWDAQGFSTHWRSRPNKEQPFFAMLNPQSTHESGLFPQTGWPKSVTHFAVQIILWQRLKNFTDVVMPEDVEVPSYYPDTPAVRATIAQQYNNITFMDGEVRQLLDQLEEDGLTGSTIIVFTTDHGDGLPRGKRSMYDLGIRVPMIVRWPEALRPENEPRGAFITRPVSFVDLAPTFLDLAGAERGTWMKGNVVFGPRRQHTRELAFSAIDRVDERPQRSRAVTDGRFKLIAEFITDTPPLLQLNFRDHLPMMEDLYALRDQGGKENDGGFYAATRPARALYDIETDPHEVHNLAGDPAYAEIQTRLEAALQLWMAENGDDGQSEADMIAAQWPGMQQPETAAPTITRMDGVVTLTSKTPGASIGWRHKGSEAWQLYTAPLAENKAPFPVETKAIRYGYAESRVTTEEAE